MSIPRLSPALACKVRASRIHPTLRVLVTIVCVCCSIVATRADSVTIASNVSLTVNSVVSVGGGLVPDSDSTTYALVTTTGPKKLIGRLSSAMPSHTTLTVHLDAPSGAASSGTVTLTASNQNLVTGIGVVSDSGLDMTFTFSATVQAGMVGGGSRTFVVTLVDAP